jgi:DNA gyrase/topoisomerase IV subunit B
VLAIKVANPQFQGQTKERLNNTEVTPLIDGIVRTTLENALNANRTAGDAIAGRVILAAAPARRREPPPSRCSGRAACRIA